MIALCLVDNADLCAMLLNSSAIHLPIPFAPPVMTATLLSNIKYPPHKVDIALFCKLPTKFLSLIEPAADVQHVRIKMLLLDCYALFGEQLSKSIDRPA